MVGLTSLEVYNSFFNITEENIKFKLYIFPASKKGGITYEEIRDEIEKDLDISDITAADLQDEISGPIVIQKIEKKFQKEWNMTNLWIFWCVIQIVYFKTLKVISEQIWFGWRWH